MEHLAFHPPQAHLSHPVSRAAGWATAHRALSFRPISGQAPRITRITCAAQEVDLGGSVNETDAQKFEKIAAGMVQRYAEDQEARSAQLVEELYGAGEVEEEAATPSPAEAEPRVLTGSSLPRNKRTGKVPDDCLPKIAIVGRPNVGKSAMFNRIAGTSVAVVYDEAGITRDRLYTRAFWGTTEFVLIDTGGLMSDATRLPTELQEAAMADISAEGLPAAIERQAAAGVSEADVIVLLADGQAGLQAGDRDILDWLRQNHPTKPCLLAVNKCENSLKADLMVAEFWELGVEPFAVSAISGTGTGELLDRVCKVLPPPKSSELVLDPDQPLSIAIVGRPNVGKSSLLNAICGEERSIVCDMSGTTRDAVDTQITLPSGQKLTLIDTAGIRKRSKISSTKHGPEAISVDRALRAMRRSEVVVMVIDGSEGITQQDFKLSELACGEGRAVVVVVNKWDRVDHDLWNVESYIEETRAQLRHVGWANVVCTTATEGRMVDKVLESIIEAGVEHRRRISTATLNLVMKEATQWKAPPTQRGTGRKGKIYYATQASVAPPTFVFFVNDTKLFSDDYKRYMERQLRESVGFPGTPLRLLWRGKPEQDRTLVRIKKTAEAGGRRGGDSPLQRRK